MGAKHSSSSQEADEKPLQPNADFQGPTDKRHCTDIAFIFLIIAMWVCMTGVGGDAIHKGRPQRLIAPMDSDGKLCGYTDSVKNLPNIYFVNPSMSGKCVASCPSSTVAIKSPEDLICLDGTPALNNNNMYAYITAGRCAPKMASQSKFNRCIFTNATEAALYTFNQGIGPLQEFGSDIFQARGFVFGLGTALALVFGFVWMILLRVPGLLPLIVWTSIFGFGAGLAGIAAYMIDTAGAWATRGLHSTLEVNGLRGLGWCFVALCVLYICLIIFLRKRIQVGMVILKEACKAVVEMPGIVLFPILQVVGFILFMVPWIFYCVFLAGMGTVTAKTVTAMTTDSPIQYTYRTITYTKDIQQKGWYMFFCYLWTAQFIQAMGQITLAICFSSWYFTREEHKKERIGLGVRATFSSLRKAIVYHTGTAAFGSLIIALIELARAILARIQAKVQKMPPNPVNLIIRAVLCCAQCCLWCFEKCIKFLNRNAYVQTAIFSYSFCHAAWKAFSLLLRNCARVAAIGIICSFVIFIGKLFISGLATFCVYCAITANMGSKLHGVIAPTIMTFVITYVIAIMFMEVFHMAVDTIFQCFCIDEEMFKNAPFGSESLRKIMDGLSKEARASGTRQPVSPSPMQPQAVNLEQTSEAKANVR